MILHLGNPPEVKDNSTVNLLTPPSYNDFVQDKVIVPSKRELGTGTDHLLGAPDLNPVDQIGQVSGAQKKKKKHFRRKV